MVGEGLLSLSVSLGPGLVIIDIYGLAIYIGWGYLDTCSCCLHMGWLGWVFLDQGVSSFQARAGSGGMKPQ